MTTICYVYRNHLIVEYFNKYNKKYKERQHNGFYPDKKEENKSWFRTDK